MKYKYAFHPKDYAIGQIEKFYTDMASKGWHLKRHGVWLSEFVQGQPMDMKYRVEVLIPREKFEILTMPDEQKVVFEDCGWEYVDGHGYISVLRAPADSDTEEFYIDPSQQADTLKGLRKNMIGNILFWPLWFVIYISLHSLTGENMLAQLQLVWVQFPQYIISLVVIAFLLSSDSFVGAYCVNKLYKQMKNGIPIDHSPNKASRLPVVIKSLVVLLCLVTTSTTIRSETFPIPYISDGGYVTLAEIGVDMPEENQSWLRSSGLSHIENMICDYWYASEQVNKTEFESLVWLTQDVYKFKSESDIHKTAKALMNTSTFAQYAGNFKEMEFDGLDKVYYNKDLELIVINNRYVGYFQSIFTEESKNTLLEVLRNKWK